MASTLRPQHWTDFRHGKGRKQPPDLRPSLPIELWLWIISYIDGRNELSNLSRTSQWLQELIQVRLYGHLTITTPLDQQPGSFIKLDKRRRNLLLRTILSPRAANLVTTFQIKLPRCDRMNSIWPKSLLFGDRCGCGNLDDHLGNALRALPNLQALQIRCSFCEDTTGTRHFYLAKLAAKNLQELRLTCRCSRNGEKSQAILSSPCLDSVTRLQWMIAVGRVDSIARISPQHTRDVLPLVRKLSYDHAIFDEIVSHRRITHLECHTMNTDLHQAIRTNEGHLVHVRMGDCLKLIGFLEVDSQPYRNVRHVGCFHFGWNKGDEILRYMLPFSVLEQLGSIEVSTYHRAHRSSMISIEQIGDEVWEEAFLVGLQKQHPKLKKVFLKVILNINKLTGEKADFFVWERSQAWKEHMIAPFTEWDMAIGLEPRALF